MKSAYELAMERLNQSAPIAPVSDQQKKEIAELDSRYQARLAEREITLTGEIAALRAGGDFEKAAQLEQELAAERRKLAADLEEKKERVRAAGGKSARR